MNASSLTAVVQTLGCGRSFQVYAWVAPSLGWGYREFQRRSDPFARKVILRGARRQSWSRQRAAKGSAKRSREAARAKP